MSSRQMKRALVTSIPSTGDDLDLEPETRARPIGFAFSDSDTSEESDESDDPDDEAAQPNLQTNLLSAPESKLAPPPQPSAPTLKSKKNKAQKKQSQDYNESEFLERAAEMARREAVEHAVDQSGENEKKEIAKKYLLFSVIPKNFSVEAELKRKFGAAAVASAEFQSSGNRPRQSRYQPRGRNKPTMRNKNTVLVKPDPNWPRPPTLQSGNGIGMVVSEGTNQPFEEGCTYYRYSHGTEVEVLDMEYNQRVQTHDPNQIQMHVQVRQCLIIYYLFHLIFNCFSTSTSSIIFFSTQYPVLY